MACIHFSPKKFGAFSVPNSKIGENLRPKYQKKKLFLFLLLVLLCTLDSIWLDNTTSTFYFYFLGEINNLNIEFINFG